MKKTILQRGNAIAALCFFLCLLLYDVHLIRTNRFPAFGPLSDSVFASAVPLSGQGVSVPTQASNEPTSSNLSQRLSKKLLRLHIIADNDTEEAQQVKLLVRDAVCASLRALPEELSSKEAVVSYLSERLEALVFEANAVLEANQCDYRAVASIEKRFFPLKTYGAYTFPAGEYDALCITLGSGKGQNWWCLAFPSLCLLDGTYAVTDTDSAHRLKILLTDEEYDAILLQKPKVRFRFRLLEWLKGRFK